MKLGYIGLGKMGKGMVLQLLEKGHKVHAFDISKAAVSAVAKKGAKGFDSPQAVVESLNGSRLIWIMVPYKFVDDVLKAITPLLKKGDTVIDGGNSPYKESIRRGKALAKKGVNFLDVGVSGGPDAARHGACMMIGGKKSIYKKYEKLIKDICVKDGYGYMGQSGAGHYIKMVHNGIEYGMMQAIAEGFSILDKTKEFNLNMNEVTRVYQHGSVIESRLIGWLGNAFKKFGTGLKKVSPRAVGSGEGYWTTRVAHNLKVKDKVIHEALDARVLTHKKPSFQGRIIMAIRNQFGGHDIDPKKLTIK